MHSVRPCTALALLLATACGSAPPGPTAPDLPGTYWQGSEDGDTSKWLVLRPDQSFTLTVNPDAHMGTLSTDGQWVYAGQDHGMELVELALRAGGSAHLPDKLTVALFLDEIPASDARLPEWWFVWAVVSNCRPVKDFIWHPRAGR